jgi:hypothetical protein
MPRIEGARIVLNNEEAEAFLQSAMHPDREALRRRDAFLEESQRVWVSGDHGIANEIDFEPKKKKIQSTINATETLLMASILPSACNVEVIGQESVYISCFSLTDERINISVRSDSLVAA